MIQSFGNSATKALFHGTSASKSRRIPADVPRATLRKLDMLDAARDLKDLRSPPGNRLEALKGRLRGAHSIRVNEQWRITFIWAEAGPGDVSLVDYH